MNTDFSKFAVYSVILTLFSILGAFLIIKYLVVMEPPTGIYWTIPFVALLNLISAKMMINAKEKNPHQFVTAFTLSMMVKFLATAVLLLVCGLLDNENFKPVALTIGVVYLMFLVLEVFFVKKALNP